MDDLAKQMELDDASKCVIFEFSRAPPKGSNLNLVCVIDIN
jgi:hypothetical protein